MLSRRVFLYALGASGIVPSSGAAAGRANEQYPFGAIHMSTIPHWQHYLPPLDEWTRYIDTDIRRMKSVGFNTVVIHIDWYDIEPAEGRFAFERHDRLMDLIDQQNMSALLWPWPELQPEWVVKLYPESEWIASDGYRAGSACWDHFSVRALIERFVDRVVKRYKDRPSVIGWDLGAEAGIWVSGVSNPVDQAPTARLYCYCASTASRYREWLKRKYGAIGNLNETWATYYDDWAQIEPVRTGVFERAQIFWLDWREFMLWNTAEFQALKIRSARNAGAKPPITAHIGGWGAGYAYHAADEFQIAKHVDILALSLFPFWLQKSEPYKPAYGALMLDGIRSAANGKPIWVEELQGGPSIFGLAYRSPTPRPEDIRLWTWQSIAHGANGIFYWNWRPETTGIEASGFGLVNYDGSISDRATAAGEVSSVVQKHAAFFAHARPAPAEIAIFHSPRTSLLATGEGEEGHYRRSLRGLYTALWESGYSVDLLVAEQLTGDLTRYKIIYLPFAYTLSVAEGQRLREFIRAGGAVYAELWCGLKDDRTFLYETVPGAGMAEALGCKEVSVDPGAGTLRIVRTTPCVRVPEGSTLPLFNYRENVETAAGAVVVGEFEDGRPALVSNRFGKGWSIYAATMLCHSYDSSPQPAVRELLAGLAESAGVRSPVRIRAGVERGDIETRMLVCEGGRRAALILNHGARSRQIEVSIDGNPGSLWFDILKGTKVQVGVEAPAGWVSLSLPPFSVQVLTPQS
jgi:beta-galactosidase GanA